MQHLTRDDLYSLEKYAELRPQMRAQVLEHKKNRAVAIGPNATLYFENRLTMHYQIQEMLRVERVYEAAGIQDELNAYNPMIPDGANLKATFMLEYPDESERRVALAGLKGVEDRVWMQVHGFDKVWAIADEDLERENEEKTSSVHFLRFEFNPAMIAAAKAGAPLAIGIDHAAYRHTGDPIASRVYASLVKDFS